MFVLSLENNNYDMFKKTLSEQTINNFTEHELYSLFIKCIEDIKDSGYEHKLLSKTLYESSWSLKKRELIDNGETHNDTDLYLLQFDDCDVKINVVKENDYWKVVLSDKKFPNYILNPNFIVIVYDKTKIVIQEKQDIDYINSNFNKHFFTLTTRLPDDYEDNLPLFYVKYPYGNIDKTIKFEDCDGTLIFINPTGMAYYLAGLGGGKMSGMQGYIMNGYKDAVVKIGKKYGLVIDEKFKSSNKATSPDPEPHGSPVR